MSLITLFPIRSLFSRALVFASMALTAWVFYRGNEWLHWWHLSGQALVCAFLWACTIYVFKDHIPYSAPLAIAALVVADIFLFSSRFEVRATAANHVPGADAGWSGYGTPRLVRRRPLNTSCMPADLPV